MRQQWLKFHSDMIGFSTATKRRYPIVQSSLNVSAGTEEVGQQAAKHHGY
jgi:hypothetical protein